MFKKLSIPHKLTAIIMLACIIILIMTSGIAILTEKYLFRQGMVDKIMSLSRIVGANSRYALVYRNPETAEDTLSTLSAEHHINAAIIFDGDGKPFASYRNPSQTSMDKGRCLALPSVLEREEETYCITSDHLAMFTPIFLDGEKIGSVYLLSDMKELQRRLWYVGVRLLLVFSTSFPVLFSVFLNK